MRELLATIVAFATVLLAASIDCENFSLKWAFHPKFSGLQIQDPNEYSCYAYEDNYPAFQNQLQRAIIFNSVSSISCLYYEKELNFVCHHIDSDDRSFYSKVDSSFVVNLYRAYNVNGSVKPLPGQDR